MPLPLAFFKRYERERSGDRVSAGQLGSSTRGDLAYLIYLFSRGSAEARAQALREAGLASKPEKPAKCPYHATVHECFLQFFRDNRGCERGFCCVYSMWFDPSYICLRKCTHTCHISRGRFAHCGPSLLENSVLTRNFIKFARRNQCNLAPRGEDCTPHILSKRRKVQKRPREECPPPQTSNPSPSPPLPVHAPCIHTRGPAVELEAPHAKRRRSKRDISSLSRIRKCMGSRTFGRIGSKGKKEIPRFLGGVVPLLHPIGSRSSRVLNPPS